MDRKLLNAFRQGKTYQIEKLAVENPLVLRGRTFQENTSLHLAALLGSKHVIELILRHEPTFLYERNRNDETPLHLAAKVGNARATETLVEYFRTKVSGSVAGQENILRMRDNQGNTPLHGAVRSHYNLTALLLMNDDPETILLVNDANQSPLSIAVETSSKCIYSTYIGWLIIKEHPSSLDYRGPNKLTLLHCAVIKQEYVLVAEILIKKKELINELDDYGRNPLHYAAILGNEAIARLLLDADDDPSSFIYKAVDSNGKTPLHLAAENGQGNFFIMLLSSYPHDIVMVDGEQRNILHLAALNGNVVIVKFILTCIQFEDSINSPDMYGNTPLHLSAQNFHEDVVDVLSKNMKVDIRATNHSNLTALATVESNTDSERDTEKQFLTLKILKEAIRARAFYPEVILQDDRVFNRLENDFRQTRYGEHREMAQTLLVMATLIAAFTVTAAFTLPGGYEDHGPYKGMARFVGKPGFIVCVIMVTIAMASSMTAAVLCLGQIGYGKYKRYRNVNFIRMAIPLIMLGLFSMSLAFVGALVEVLYSNMTLAITVAAIGGSFPFILYYLGPIIFGLESEEIKLFQEGLSVAVGLRQFVRQFARHFVWVRFHTFGMLRFDSVDLGYRLRSAKLYLYDRKMKVFLKYGQRAHPVVVIVIVIAEILRCLCTRN